MADQNPPNYESYLKLAELLTLQRPLAKPESHDELQFIIVHQTYELWFKLLTHEIKAVMKALEEKNLSQVIWLMKRCNEITRVLNQQIQIMETMSPMVFLEFRDLLNPASGLQSYQFRALEFMSGLKNERYLNLYAPSSLGHQTLLEALEKPSLWDTFVTYLKTQGFSTESEKDQLESLKQIYQDAQWNMIHFLCEAFVEYDEAFRVWRHRHFLMAERMIGFKPGTGHHEAQKVGDQPLPSTASGESFKDAGVHYLKSRTEPRYFPLLWELRTILARPKL